MQAMSIFELKKSVPGAMRIEDCVMSLEKGTYVIETLSDGGGQLPAAFIS